MSTIFSRKKDPILYIHPPRVLNASSASRATATWAMSLPANKRGAIKPLSQSDHSGAGVFNINGRDLCSSKASAVFCFVRVLLHFIIIIKQEQRNRNYSALKSHIKHFIVKSSSCATYCLYMTSYISRDAELPTEWNNQCTIRVTISVTMFPLLYIIYV